MTEDRRIRMAKIAICLAAKSMVADEDGRQYESFTGQIKYGKTDARVENATFVLENGEISWETGTWLDGTWEKGVWKEGVWNDGTWKSGTWMLGIWLDGIWENGVWNDGMWKFGE